MNEVRVTYKVDFGRKRAPESAAGSPPSESGSEPTSKRGRQESHAGCKPPTSRTARLLALAYYIERKVEAGEIKDYAEAARLLGTSRARLSQVMNLLRLSSRLQEKILNVTSTITERNHRSVGQLVLWTDQEQFLGS